MNRDAKILDSTGNIFEDMGSRDADERLARAELARVIRRTIRDRGLTQVEAAFRCLGFSTEATRTDYRNSIGSLSSPPTGNRT